MNVVTVNVVTVNGGGGMDDGEGGRGEGDEEMKQTGRMLSSQRNRSGSDLLGGRDMCHRRIT